MRQLFILAVLLCPLPCLGQQANLLNQAKQELDYIAPSKLGNKHVDWQNQLQPLYRQWFNIAFTVRGGAIRIEQAIEKRRVKSEEVTQSSRYGDDSRTGDRKTEEEVERVSTYVNVSPNRNVSGLRYWYDFNSRRVAQIGGLLYRSQGSKIEVLSAWNLHQPNGISAVLDDNSVPLVIAHYEKGKLHGACCLFQDGIPHFAATYHSGRLREEFAFNGFHWNQCTGNKVDSVIGARRRLTNLIDQRLETVFQTAWAEAGAITKQARQGRAYQKQSMRQLQNAQRKGVMGAAHARQQSGRP